MRWCAIWTVLFSGAAASAGQLTIAWFDNSNNETSFKIERAGPDLAFQQIATVSADTWFYTDNTVIPSISYWYRVRASNAGGDSAYSNTIVATAPIAAGTAPVISHIANTTISADSSTGPLAFTVGDAETLASSLVLTGASSNPALVPDSSIVFGGSGWNRTIAVTPAAVQTGTAMIITTVSDGALTATDTFVLTVTGADTAPPTTAPIRPVTFLPTITSPRSITSIVGLGFFYTITATNSPTKFDAINLPPGLIVNPTTGVVTGAPTTTGTFDVTLVAANASGTQVATLTLQVNPTTPPIDQTVAFPPLIDSIVVGQPVRLTATASSGLPLTFSVVRGNAVLSGDTMTIYDTGIVTVKATQGGTADFKPANSDLTFAKARVGPGSLIYSGTIGPDPFAAAFDGRYRTGTLYLAISSTGEVLIIPLSVNADGTFDVAVQNIALDINSVNAPGLEAPESTVVAERRTIHGQIFNGTLSGIIAELGRSFSATVQPSIGPTASLAGVYTANTILSASGTTYLVADAQGQAYILSVSSEFVTTGTGRILPNGDFTIHTPQSTIFEGGVDATTGLLKGTVQLPNMPPADLWGAGVSTKRTDRLTNISSRVRVAEIGSIRGMISGFTVAGTTPKQMLLRGIGPSLSSFGVQNAVRNPRLQLFDRSGQVIAQNDDWGNAPNVSAIGDHVGAFKLAANSLDSAILVSLGPGLYTMQVGSNDGEGVALVETYDAGEDVQVASLLNMSTRGYIDTDKAAIVSGFMVGGDVPIRILVRGVGPTLAGFGVTGIVADPLLRIYQGTDVIAQNDDWEVPQTMSAAQSAASAAEIARAARGVGAFPMTTGSKDAAIVLILAPGTYTAEMSGVNNTVGSGLLEIYQLPHD